MKNAFLNQYIWVHRCYGYKDSYFAGGYYYETGSGCMHPSCPSQRLIRRCCTSGRLPWARRLKLAVATSSS